MSNVRMMKRPKLTQEEMSEKDRLLSLYKKHRPAWEAKSGGKKLTQEQLGVLVGEMMRGEPLGQGAIWQYLNKKSNTKLNADFVQAVAAVLNFDPEEVSPRFAPKSYALRHLRGLREIRGARCDSPSTQEALLIMESLSEEEAAQAVRILRTFVTKYK